MLLASSSESSKSSLSLSFLAVSGGAGASGVLWSKQWNKSDCCKGRLLSRMTLKYILYTALNSPSLIFALIGSETDLPSINWPTIHLYYLILYKYLCSPSFKFALKSEGENKTGQNFPCIQYYKLHHTQNKSNSVMDLTYCKICPPPRSFSV